MISHSVETLNPVTYFLRAISVLFGNLPDMSWIIHAPPQLHVVRLGRSKAVTLDAAVISIVR